jgi:hypothetical protein
MLMATPRRSSFTSSLVAGAMAASLLLAGCNNDVDTPPWLPNYADSGHGGKASTDGGGTGGLGAGEAGESGSGANSGEGGDAP